MISRSMHHTKLLLLSTQVYPLGRGGAPCHHILTVPLHLFNVGCKKYVEINIDWDHNNGFLHPSIQQFLKKTPSSSIKRNYLRNKTPLILMFPQDIFHDMNANDRIQQLLLSVELLNTCPEGQWLIFFYGMAKACAAP